jgi:hypothetical protein
MKPLPSERGLYLYVVGIGLLDFWVSDCRVDSPESQGRGQGAYVGGRLDYRPMGNL